MAAHNFEPFIRESSTAKRRAQVSWFHPPNPSAVPEQSLLRSLKPAMYVCNPVNKHFIKLPSRGVCERSTFDFEGRPIFYASSYVSIAIAFDSDGSSIDTSAKFKLVKVIYTRKGRGGHLTFELYSSETGAWRMSNATCRGGIWSVESKNIYIRGVLYWLACDGRILVFDVEKELARWISWPLRNSWLRGLTCMGESEGRPHYVLLAEELGLFVWCLESYSDENWTLIHDKSCDEIKEQSQRWLPNLAVRRLMLPMGFKDGILLLLVLRDVFLNDIKNSKMARVCTVQDFDPHVHPFPQRVFSPSLSLVPLNDA